MTDDAYRDEAPDSYGSPDRRPSTNGPAVAAITTGLIALALSWVPGVNLLAFVLAIVALVTGFMGLSRAGGPDMGGRGMAVTGIVTGVLAIVIGVLVYVGLVALFNDPAVQEELRRIEQEVEGVQP